METNVIENAPMAGNGLADALETLNKAPKGRKAQSRTASGVGPLTSGEMAEVIGNANEFESRVTDERFVTSVAEFVADELKDADRKLLLGRLVVAFMGAIVTVQDAMLKALAAFHKVDLPELGPTLTTNRARLAWVLYCKVPYMLETPDKGKDTRGGQRLSAAANLAKTITNEQAKAVQAKADEALGIPVLTLDAGEDKAKAPTGAKAIFAGLFKLVAAEIPADATDEQKAATLKVTEARRIELVDWFKKMNFDSKWINAAWTTAADAERGIVKETKKTK